MQISPDSIFLTPKDGKKVRIGVFNKNDKGTLRGPLYIREVILF